MTTDNFMSLEDFQNLWANKIKPGVLTFSTAYIGAGASAAAVMVPDNKKTDLLKGISTSVSASNAYLWVCTPSDNNTPTVLMNGITVPVTAQSNVTLEKVTYKVLKSNNKYTGTFNIVLI